MQKEKLNNQSKSSKAYLLEKIEEKLELLKF